VAEQRVQKVNKRCVRTVLREPVQSGRVIGPYVNMDERACAGDVVRRCRQSAQVKAKGGEAEDGGDGLEDVDVDIGQVVRRSHVLNELREVVGQNSKWEYLLLKTDDGAGTMFARECGSIAEDDVIRGGGPRPSPVVTVNRRVAVEVRRDVPGNRKPARVVEGDSEDRAPHSNIGHGAERQAHRSGIRSAA
jgi:hypothetical protein